MRHVPYGHCAAPSQMPPPMTEKCENCAGHGLVLDLNGEPNECRDCGGTGRVRARDKQGRFVANTNENEDPLGLGYVQFQVAKWMHELKVLDQYEGCREFVATVLNELAGGRKQ